MKYARGFIAGAMWMFMFSCTCKVLAETLLELKKQREAERVSQGLHLVED